MRTEIIAQIDQVIKEFEEFCSLAKSKDYSDRPRADAFMMKSRMASAIDRLSPPHSFHQDMLAEILSTRGHDYYLLDPLKGALLALKKEYEQNSIRSFIEIVNSDVFSDFLEMAKYFCDENYKDAAAVMAGGVLEQHLRNLSIKNSLPTKRDGRNIKADAMNSELAKQGFYGKNDQKSVTAWLGLRNDAAHANYSAYEKAQVELMIAGIRDFLNRYPA